MYKAHIYFDATEDNYDMGLIGTTVNSWEETLTAETREELRQKIADSCYSKPEEIYHSDINDYDNATEYWLDYLATEENIGDASNHDIELWKQGKKTLYLVQCHILVSEVTEKKATL